MRIAVAGCGHGTLNNIYSSIQKSCQIQGWDGVDLLIVGGDFQSVRNSYDLSCMSVPLKYRSIGNFYEYYSGKRKAPYLTLFVGGNHEASSYLNELYYGGWVAPNIYYLGAANVVRVGDLRIAGLGGIWKGYDYNKPHFERVPYTADEVKTLYHVREIDARKLLLVREQVDVGLSHDWPNGIEWLGDHKKLFRTKEHLKPDAVSGRLGNIAAKYVMDRLRPPHWFAAHLHCKFAAVVDYSKEASGQSEQSKELDPDDIPKQANDKKNEDEIDVDAVDEDVKMMEPTTTAEAIKNNEEIDLDLDEDLSAETLPPISATNDPMNTPQTPKSTSNSIVPDEIRAQLPASFARPDPSKPRKHASKHQYQRAPPPPSITNTTTRFLALDKCLPGHPFLQLLSISPLVPSSSTSTTPPLTYDPEWLSILRLFSSHDPSKPSPPNLGESAYKDQLTESRAWIDEHIVSAGKLTVPEKFEQTAPVYDGKDIRNVGSEQSQEYSNPQTKTFCELLGIENWFDASEDERRKWRERKEAVIASERQESNTQSGRGGRGGRGQNRGWNSRSNGGGGRRRR